MRFRKVLAMLLVLTMAFSLLAGCSAGGRTKADDEDGGKTAATTVKDKEKAATEAETTEETTEKETEAVETDADETEATEETEYTKGQELTEYLDHYSTAKSAMWDQITAQMENSSDFSVSMALLGFAAADLQIMIIPFFDVVDSTGGVMMLTNIKNCYKKTTAKGIEFGYDYVYEADEGNYVKGDHVLLEGILDPNGEGLWIDMKDYKQDKLTSRTVTEIMMNDKGSYSSEMIMYQADQEELSCYFTQFDDKFMDSVFAVKPAAEEFEYTRVFGEKNVGVEKMSEGFTVKTSVSLKDGKVDAKVIDGN